MLFAMVTGVNFATAQDISGNAMMGKMKPNERYPFIAGVIAGLAFARYVAGGKDSQGMYCIYDWFYKNEKTYDTIHAALVKFPDHPPASVISALAKKKCGGE